jgi:hypothetical protein
MRMESIFGPVGVLALWTLVVLAMTGTRRVRAAMAGRVPRHAFKLGESPEVPADLVLLNRNLMNLLEMPVLFYVACVVLYVTRHVDQGVLVAAWSYVGLRLAHSFVHLTTNRIIRRLVVFALGNIVLAGLWVCLLWRVL